MLPYLIYSTAPLAKLIRAFHVGFVALGKVFYLVLVLYGFLAIQADEPVLIKYLIVSRRRVSHRDIFNFTVRARFRILVGLPLFEAGIAVECLAALALDHFLNAVVA